MNVEEEDEQVTKEKPRKCCRKPFIFKILKLNMPEINWIILGCITSMIFGAVSPVKSPSFSLFIIWSNVSLSLLQLFSLFFTTIYETFVDEDQHRANIKTRNYALIIFFTGVGGGICQCLSSIAFSMSGEALTMRMRRISFASMLRQEIGWFDREENNLGALVTQLSSDTSSLKVINERFSRNREDREIPL